MRVIRSLRAASRMHLNLAGGIWSLPRGTAEAANKRLRHMLDAVTRDDYIFSNVLALCLRIGSQVAMYRAWGATEVSRRNSLFCNSPA